MTLSEFIYNCIEAGWEKVVNGDVKQKDESVKQGEQKPLV
jgi:hypothetical protein